ncbi:unnamed protein product [Cylindrotheca closterium]|uniref:Uncharacterized protein n=1 Tax=Cylindrotheca closterium TaxID=2856 RepID=A0AAD2FID5_9STRA|nr:unnamed protein product [Cylindrotheca closterium]
MPKQYDNGWASHIKELKKFKEKFGHCNVRRTQKDYIRLSYWIRRVRGLYKLRRAGKRTSLTDERVKELDDLGFGWEGWSANRDDVFQTRIKEMKEFRKRHGHCNLPCPYAHNPTLKSWTNGMRQKYRQYQAGEKTTLTPEQIAELESIGFDWNVASTSSRRGAKVQPSHESVISNDQGSSQPYETQSYYQEHVSVPMNGGNSPSTPAGPFSGLESLAEICRVVSKEEEHSIHSSSQANTPNKKQRRKFKEGCGHWTDAEHEAFLEALDKFGRKWTKIASTIPTRSTSQVRSHAQKYFDKLKRGHQDVSDGDFGALVESIESGSYNFSQSSAR